MSNRKMKVVKVRGPRQNSRKPRGTAGSGVAIVPIGTNANAKLVLFKNIIPPSLVTRLRYIVNRNINNAGIQAASIQLNANGVYDVDPSLASTAVPGFNEFAALYQKYRVLKVKTSCTFVNREAFPILCNLGFDRSFYAANAKVLAFYESENQKTQILPSAQSSVGPSNTLSMSKTSMEMIGDMEGEGSANWANFVNGNPASLYYCSIAISGQNIGAALVLGAVVRWETEFDVEFYLPKNLNA